VRYGCHGTRRTAPRDRGSGGAVLGGDIGGQLGRLVNLERRRCVADRDRGDGALGRRWWRWRVLVEESPQAQIRAIVGRIASRVERLVTGSSLIGSPGVSTEVGLV